MYKHLNLQSKTNRFIVTLLFACFGGIIFDLLHIPIPWLLGPLVAIMLGSKFSRLPLYWPSRIRDIGMIIVGYSMGLSFTKNALHQIMFQLPSIILMTIILISFCSLVALIASKLSGIDYPTILTGSIPGGLSQMVTLAEEMKGIDLTIVTFLQVARLMMIIFLVPLFIFNPFFGVSKSVVDHYLQAGEPQWGALVPNIFLFAVVSIFCAFIGKKVNIPTSFLVGPIIGTAIMNISGIHGPALPSLLLDISQLMIGTYIGLLLQPAKVKNKSKVILIAIISGFSLLLGSLGLSLLLKYFYSTTISTSYLSLAPGGMDQMSIIAHEVNADLSMVVGYQLFRLFFIFFVVPPILKMFFKKLMKRQGNTPN